MKCAVLGQDLHQALRARLGRLVAELRLAVDHGRDQRGIEVLVARLLADHVLVAQRQRDLLDRVVHHRAQHDRRRPPRRRAIAEQDDGQPAAPGAAARRRDRVRRAQCARRRAATRPLIRVTRAFSSSSTSPTVPSRSAREPSLWITKSARAAFSSWRELAPVAARHALVAAGGGPLLAQRLVGDHRDRGVEEPFPARLEQQRHLHHRDLGRRIAALELGPPGGGPHPHAREQLALQPRQLLRAARTRSRRPPRGPPRRPRRRARPSARAAGRAPRRSRAARARRRRSRAWPRPAARRRPAPRTCRSRGLRSSRRTATS